jgi:hypothetical protein
MQDPFGRLPAPDSYAGSTAPSITGFSGHPTRFSRLRASPRDTDDSDDRNRSGGAAELDAALNRFVTQNALPGAAAGVVAWDALPDCLYD